VTVVTSNWLADADLLAKHGLRFNTDLRFTGGSDTDFYRKVRSAGHPTGWAPKAVVTETISAERTSLRYQFRRAMEQSRMSFSHKFQSESHAVILLSVLPVAFGRLIGLVALVLVLPIGGGPALIQLARSAGWLAGRVTALFGARSTLYRNTTGY
jgi:hypothetical protein